MQSEVMILRGLWSKAGSEGARARLLAGFREEVRREVYRLTGDAGLLAGLAGELPNSGSAIGESGPVSPISGALELVQVGQLECKSLEQRVEKAQKRQDRRLVKKLAKAWRKRQSENLRTGLEMARRLSAASP